MQGIYFSGAYFLTWIFVYVYVVINTFFDAQPDWLWILIGIFMPIQGLYKLIVYLRPRYLRLHGHTLGKGTILIPTDVKSIKIALLNEHCPVD